MVKLCWTALFFFLVLFTTHPIASSKGIKLKKGSKKNTGTKRPIKLKKKGGSTPPKKPPANDHPTQSQIEQLAATPDSPPPPPPPETDEATIIIVDPPDESTVAGSAFDVAVQIAPVNPEFFTESFNTTDSRVCISLDGSPYNCWPVFGGKIRFINVIDGPHTLHAVLQRRGTLLPSTITPSIHFTTVEDPDIETPETEDEDEGEEDEIDLDKKDKKVTLDMPSLSLTVPLEKVTLPGVAVQFVSNVVATDTDLFKTHFIHQFTCFNIDLSTFHACWSIFDQGVVPYITGLEPGLHTVEGVITHPETRKEIPETGFETRTFYTAGEKNEAAAVVVEVDVDGVTYEIPVVEGGDVSVQGKYFCGSRGILNEECPGYVERTILEKAGM
ncbi:hypothetical protein TrVE_jg8409 [Triparma verrucosa]|uniref:Uncharacterized protein n=1 Tax=Triparma verrucosa TaxID=1606542 RepID=A0A9W6Z7M9_9STRA|nr:hypothetical protein TrVE_jg8409 [Triparma verrucosa]